MESIVGKRVVKGVTSYKVKWKSYGHKHNVWRPETELQCDELVQEFEKRREAKQKEHRRRSDRIKSKQAQGLMAYMIIAAAVTDCGSLLPGDDTEQAVRYLHWKQGL